MKKAYRYTSEKSDKFWRIERADEVLVVNYGKIGTTGKYQVKEFATSQECETAAKKLISAKIKKGYQAYLTFDYDEHFYFDDMEIGPHKLTSHPKFRKYFSENFYYSCVDEEAPFGSDDGADTLNLLQEEFRKRGSINFADFPRKVIEEWWETRYFPPKAETRAELEKIIVDNEQHPMISTDFVTYAVAFAQIKITGKIDAKLKEDALFSMRRIEIIADILGWSKEWFNKPEFHDFEIKEGITSKMISDLENFCEIKI